MTQLRSKFLGGLLAAALLLQSSWSFSQNTNAENSGPQSNDSSAATTAQPSDGSKVTKPELPETPSGQQPAGTNTLPANPEPSAPTGTAAAPAIQMSGNPVSRPAGAAIAPANQHRVRSLMIKMGLLAGVGVAVGTVAALTIASPSRVPGSPGGR